jgi:hypothetical protein
MKRLKKVAAIVSLLMLISVSAPHALAGAVETPGIYVPSVQVEVSGAVETPGFTAVILFMAKLIM